MKVLTKVWTAVCLSALFSGQNAFASGEKCTDLFKPDFTWALFPKAADSLRAPFKIRDERVAVAVEQIRGLKIAYLKVPEALYSTTPKILRKISINDEFAAVVCRSISKVQAEQKLSDGFLYPKQLQWLARDILLRMAHLPSTPGAVRSDEDFASEVALAGLKFETVPVAYRFDSRPPSTIVREGFTPNPAKTAMTLMENVNQGADGGGSFVSLTTEAENRHIARDKYFAKEHLDPQTHAAEIERILKTGTFYDEMFNPGVPLVEIPEREAITHEKMILNRAYEYRMGPINGVDPGDLTVSNEKELIVNRVDATAVKYYREVYHLNLKHVRYHTYDAVSYGPWRAMSGF